MTLDKVIRDAYLPAIAIIGVKDSPETRVMILAIGLQESRFEYRRQMGNGPAMGYWQFERGGSVKGVLNHPASAAKARTLCHARSVTPEPMSAWLALENDDVLAAGFARLLLLTDPPALPAVTDAQGAWDCYLHNWRPGKPHRATWDAFHARAVAHG
jgi:hypothetical protein